MSSRPGRYLFDPAITQPQCRFPCEIREHVHDSDLPSNRAHLADTDPELLPLRRSSVELEVWDD